MKVLKRKICLKTREAWRNWRSYRKRAKLLLKKSKHNISALWIKYIRKISSNWNQKVVLMIVKIMKNKNLKNQKNQLRPRSNMNAIKNKRMNK